jgi:hypothetical protein
MLYLSLFFKTHRSTYCDLLNRARMDGDWEAWLEFFAEAVTTTAGRAVDTVQCLETMAERHRDRIQSLGRAAGSALRVHHELLRRPLCRSGLPVRRTMASSGLHGAETVLRRRSQHLLEPADLLLACSPVWAIFGG